MCKLSSEEMALLQDAQNYVYHIAFKDTIFNPHTQHVCFTLSQMVAALRDGFTYFDHYKDNVRTDFEHIEFYRVWRVGLPDYVTVGEVPELKLLFDCPPINF